MTAKIVSSLQHCEKCMQFTILKNATAQSTKIETEKYIPRNFVLISERSRWIACYLSIFAQFREEALFIDTQS